MLSLPALRPQFNALKLHLVEYKDRIVRWTQGNPKESVGWAFFSMSFSLGKLYYSCQEKFGGVY